METIYNLINLIVLPFWGLMIVAPGWQFTRRVMDSLIPIAIIPVFYVALLASQLGGMAAAPDFSLTGIAALLGTPAGAVIGWAHFLAFDLFVGRWAYLDSRARGINPWLTALALFFIFMAGPLGLLLYLGVRKFKPGTVPDSN